MERRNRSLASYNSQDLTPVFLSLVSSFLDPSFSSSSSSSAPSATGRAPSQPPPSTKYPHLECSSDPSSPFCYAPTTSFSHRAYSISRSIADVYSELLSRVSHDAKPYAFSSAAFSPSPSLLSPPPSLSDFDAIFSPSVASRLSLCASSLDSLKSSAPPASHESGVLECLVHALQRTTALFEAVRACRHRGDVGPLHSGPRPPPFSGGRGRGKGGGKEDADAGKAALMTDEEVGEFRAFEERLGPSMRRLEGGGDDGGAKAVKARTHFSYKRSDKATVSAGDNKSDATSRLPPHLFPSSPTSSSSNSPSSHAFSHKNVSFDAALSSESVSSSPSRSGLAAFSRDSLLERQVLIARYQSELSAVTTVEQSMSEVTSLLSSFADLIDKQADAILTIKDNAKQAKEEVEKGQDELNTAKKRKEDSSYWVPTFILVLSVLLLFLNWFTP